MGIASDIFSAWRRPQTVIRAKLAQGLREDRALAVIMAAGVLAFVAQWPALARAAQNDPSIPFDARLGGALLACVFFLPLLAYFAGFISHLIAKMLGGRGTGYGARLALFWAFLAVTPAMLLQGALTGFLGSGAVLGAVKLMVLIGFLWIWINMLIASQRGDHAG